MDKEITRNWLAILIIFTASLAFFSFKAGDITLQFTGDENFYFQASRQMLEEGDWITPKYYGEMRFQKPFLFYWLIASSFKIFGITWYAARFPSILSGALLVLLTYIIGKALFGKRAGIFSSMILATSLKFFKYTRAAIPDMALLLFIGLAVYFFIKGLKDSRRRKINFLMIFVMSAFATLVKGPIGFITPLLVIISFILFSKERSLFKELRIGWGLAAYGLILAPWFIIMIKLHGAEYINHIWTREILHRIFYFSETKHGGGLFLEYLGSLFFYIPIIIVRFLPWSVFIPAAFIGGYKARKDRHTLFIILWFSTVLVFFSLLGEKHSQYALGLSVPLALILGRFFWYWTKTNRARLAVPAAITSFLVLLFILIFSFPIFRPNNLVLAEFSFRILDYGLKEGDEVAVGSHDLIPQKLEVYLGRPVLKLGVEWYNKVDSENINKIRLKDFLTKRSRVFCLIKKADYLAYVEPALRKRLHVIGKDFLWKRRFSFSDRKLKSEYWLVTNKPR